MAEKSTNKVILIKIFVCLLGIALALYIALLEPPDPLNVNSMRLLGIFACAVIWLMVNLIPDFVVIIAALAAIVMAKVGTNAQVFATFTSDTTWLLIGALSIGAGLSKSGLLSRMALGIMSKFPGTFRGMTSAIFVAATVINPTIPSGTAKVSIFSPFVKEIAERMGFEQGSKGALGLFMSMFIPAGILYTIFLSASYFNYTVLGFIPAAARADVTWMSWLSYTALWGIIVSLLMYFFIQFTMKPKEEKNVGMGYFKERLEAMGSISKHEKYMIIILIIALLCWMTERMHGFSAGTIALLCLVAMVGLGVINREDFRARVPWDAILFILGIMTMAGLFTTTRVDKWMSMVVGPYIEPIFVSPYVFIIAVCVFIFLIRFVVISQTVCLAVFVTMLAPLAATHGMHPVIPALLCITSVNIWAVPYQNTTYLTAYYASGAMLNHSQVWPASLAYTVANMIGWLVTVPIWKLLGLIT